MASIERVREAKGKLESGLGSEDQYQDVLAEALCEEGIAPARSEALEFVMDATRSADGRLRSSALGVVERLVDKEGGVFRATTRNLTRIVHRNLVGVRDATTGPKAGIENHIERISSLLR